MTAYRTPYDRGVMTIDMNQQADRGRNLARELECDEDEATFEDKVGGAVTPLKPDLEPYKSSNVR